MGRCSRMLLRFLHAMVSDRDRVRSLLFGTRLSNITRCSCRRDVDLAMNAATAVASGWSGGIRIGTCLRECNVTSSRRMLSQGAKAVMPHSDESCPAHNLASPAEVLSRPMARHQNDAVLWVGVSKVGA